MLRTAAAAAIVAAVSARVGDSWGTNIHWTSGLPGEPAMLSQAYRVARMDFDWQSIEPATACGTYNFSRYDTLLSQMQQAGVRPYWIMDYSNACYTPTPGAGCNTTQCINAYGAFAAAAVAHFRGNNVVWETINEPDGMGEDSAKTLTALAKAAGVAMKAAGETFVGPATAGMDWAYINATFAYGILTAYTNVSVHPYRASAPETVLDDWVTLRAMIANYTPEGETPLNPISGEWGYTSAGPACAYGNKQPQQYQAAYLARMWLTNAIADIAVSINYDWKDDGTDPQDCESNFGSVYANYTGNASAPFLPKPKYMAAHTLQTLLGGSSGVNGRITPSSITPAAGGTPTAPTAGDVFIVEFNPPEGVPAGSTPSFAVWTNGSYAADNQCSGTPGSVIDCGFYGISQQECLSRGCCFVTPDPPGMPQCYRSMITTCSSIAASARTACGGANPSEGDCLAAGCCYDEWAPASSPQCFNGNGPTTVTFSSPAVPAGTCFATVDMLGQYSSDRVCADASGTITVGVIDRPAYLV